MNKKKRPVCQYMMQDGICGETATHGAMCAEHKLRRLTRSERIQRAVDQGYDTFDDYYDGQDRYENF